MVPIHSALYFLTDSKEVTKKTRVYINLDGFLILAYTRQDVLLHLHDLFGDVVKKVTKKLWIYIKKHGSCMLLLLPADCTCCGRALPLLRWAAFARAVASCLRAKRFFLDLLWHRLNNGRVIKPDTTLKAVMPVASPRNSRLEGW